MSIFNNNVETIVHFPSANIDDPHVQKMALKEGLSVVDTLTFSLYATNQGYDKVFELTTRVKVLDVRDNSIRFTGRILDINNKMDSSGVVYKEITAEGALSFLNDTKLRGSSFYADNVTGFLSQILGVHNSKVESGKQIQIGNVDIPGNVIHTCEFKTTFSEIIAVKEKLGGQIRIREVNDILYMDWLQSFSDTVLEVSLGVNMKDMIVSKDVTSLGTRIIPIGANNLTIESVNGGLDYLEDAGAKAIYGVIEKTVEYRDIEDATILRNTCISGISEHTQPSYILTSNALDLSFLSGNKAEQFALGVKLHLLNRFMGVDSIYSIVNIDLDLLEPYNPNLTISKKPVTLSTAINDLRKSSIQNNGVYNNVQIGSAYGIRAVRSDNKVVTTMNATEGISIENQNQKVFYVDINGKLVAVDITAQGGTFDNITVNQGTFNDITAQGGTFDSITATGGLTIQDNSASCTINSSGVHLVGSSGAIADVEIIEDGSHTGVNIPDDLYVQDVLRVFGKLNAEADARFYANVKINGTLTLDDVTLDDYVNDLIHDYSVAHNWET
jgi:phage minor structural protein